MPDRLTSLDQSYLYLERSPVVLHMGGLLLFDAPVGGLDFQALQDHIRDRIAFAPRFRQRLRSVPFRAGTDVWVDDEHFDIAYHVRRVSLPAPGSMDQLQELVARIQPQPLDRSRPLWECYVVEGLPQGRFALITKTHLVLVDGINAVDLSHLLLDTTPRPTPPPEDNWRPAPEPSALELWTGALADSVRRPPLMLEVISANVSDLRTGGAQLVRGIGEVAFAARGVSSTAASPFNAEIGPQRRFRTVDTDLADYREIRRRHPWPGLETSVHDVVLTVLAGAMRTWLLGSGTPVDPATTVRVLTPLMLETDQTHEIEGVLVDLPVGEPNPVVRLQQVSYQSAERRRGRRVVPATRMSEFAAYTPGTVHSLAARLAGQLSRRMFNVVVTNVPGPARPRYVLGARLRAAYPVMPLGPFQTLTVGLTSVGGRICYGLNGDREAMTDLDVLGDGISQALAELLG